MLSRDPSTAAVVFAALVLVLYGLYSRRTRSKLPLPPGPPKLPLLGNVLDIPASHTWETYTAWSKQYNSDILHLNLAGTSVIILTSLASTDALLEKRSSIYSDRARLPMLVDLMGYDYDVAIMKYGEEWRMHRRLFDQKFTRKECMKYQPRQLMATHRFLRRFLTEPEDFMRHFGLWASEMTMAVTYGIEVSSAEDPVLLLGKEAIQTLSNAGVPGKYLVDALPILQYVPSWLPGAGFKRDAKKWRKLAQDLADVPLAETKRQMALGIAGPSFTADCLNGLKDSDNKYYTESTVRGMAGTMFIAGADSSISVMGVFLLAMLANPEAQRKAQAEIDSVTKGTRLPDFRDQDDLPYVSAIVKETLRWKPVGPIAIPHFCPVEDEYKGYRIPANSIVIGNTSALMSDETVYPDPHTFTPERFLLDDGTPNPAVPYPDAAFGYGRRLCPGHHMAKNSLFIATASILAAFDITKALDEVGREIEPSYKLDSGFISAPLPFKCSIKPRSERAVELIGATGSDEVRI
ncbi:cytochrome P450 [Mycena polygramma]|nr:cytochrome P450 [Mycena polygramma]